MKKYLVERLLSQEDTDFTQISKSRSRKRQKLANFHAGITPLLDHAPLATPPANIYKISISAYEKFARKFIHECNRQCHDDFNLFLRDHLDGDFCHIGRHYDREKATNPAPNNPGRMKNYYEVHGVSDFLNYFTGFFHQFPDAVFNMGDVHVSSNVNKRRSTLVFAYQATSTVCYQLPVNDAVLTHPESKATDEHVPMADDALSEVPLQLTPHLSLASDDQSTEPLSATDATSLEGDSSLFLPGSSADSVTSDEDSSVGPMDLELTLRGYIVMQFEEYDVHKVSRIDFHYYIFNSQPPKAVMVV